jgi:hypothetical protein
LPGDSTLVVDRDQRRFLLIDPDGRPIKTIAPPPAFGAGVELARFADQAGRVYFPMRFIDSSSTVPLLRWNRSTDRLDTIAALVPNRPEKQGHRVNTGGSTALVFYFSPFPAADGWVAFPDGTTIVIRSPGYYAEIISPRGVSRKAPPIAFDKVAVTASERKKYQPRRLADVKASFSAFDILASPDGEVWVRHYMAENATTTRWDVLNGQGVRIATVYVPKGRAIVGLSRSKVYMYRTDDDGLNWIEAYSR